MSSGPVSCCADGRRRIATTSRDRKGAGGGRSLPNGPGLLAEMQHDPRGRSQTTDRRLAPGPGRARLRPWHTGRSPAAGTVPLVSHRLSRAHRRGRQPESRGNEYRGTGRSRRRQGTRRRCHAGTRRRTPGISSFLHRHELARARRYQGTDRHGSLGRLQAPPARGRPRRRSRVDRELPAKRRLLSRSPTEPNNLSRRKCRKAAASRSLSPSALS